MKKNKLLWIVISAAGVLIAAVVIVAAVLVSGQMKEDKYYEQLKTAKNYMADMDYDQVVEAYKAAIELQPENAQAYMELAEVYIEMENYYEASYMAELGYQRTKDENLTKLKERIAELRSQGTVTSFVSNGLPEENKPVFDDKDDSEVSIRYATVENVANFCYQEYVSAYGDATVTKASGDDGYQAKFKGFNALAYFKNTPENKKAIDEATRKPAKNAKPYKVVLTSPTLLFVGYNDYISYEKLAKYFSVDTEPVYDSDAGKYFLEFEYMDCTVRLETDASGNMGKNPLIELYPKDLIKEDYVEETETEETKETEEQDSFMLAGNRYTYDVTSIEIYNASIDDLSPLSQCDQLRELILVDCSLGSLSPMSGCISLETLNLMGSVGFSDLSPLSGLGSLKYLCLHGAVDVSDLGPIMNLSLQVLDTCFSGISEEQAKAYKAAHPDCLVWWNNYAVE